MMTTTTTMNRSAMLVRKALQTTSIRKNASILLGVASMTTTTSSSLVLCEGSNMLDKILKKQRDGSLDWNATMDGLAKQVGSQVQVGIDSGVPTQLSYGFISGYCSGLALKQAGRAAAVVLGTCCAVVVVVVVVVVVLMPHPPTPSRFWLCGVAGIGLVGICPGRSRPCQKGRGTNAGPQRRWQD